MVATFVRSTISRNVLARTLPVYCWLLTVACAPSPSGSASSPPRTPAATPDEPSSVTARPEASSGEKPATQPEPSHLSEAEGGPSPAYSMPEHSTGLLQSPINIVTSRTVPGKHAVALHYQTSREHVTNLGHTVKVVYDPGSSLEFDGKVYDFVQFHFHTPSEHLLDGVTYPMEMHLVHTEHGHPDRYLVVGVLFKEGGADSLLDTLLSAVPPTVGATADEDQTLDASAIFSPGEGYYHYKGSLTTPPYTESVDWLVLKRVHEASAEQVQAFNRLEGNNARHIQEVRARLVDQN